MNHCPYSWQRIKKFKKTAPVAKCATSAAPGVDRFHSVFHSSTGIHVFNKRKRARLGSSVPADQGRYGANGGIRARFSLPV